MMKIISILPLLIVVLALQCCDSKAKSVNTHQPEIADSSIVGGPCDGCDLMYISMPSEIQSTDTSEGWYGEGQKISIEGRVLKSDKKTPAPGVILYYWQTATSGYYVQKGEMDQRAKRHGYIRGWIKTDRNGKYKLLSIMPAPYPNDNVPAHIHLLVKEPGLPNEYYIDELVFEGDPLLTSKKREAMENRGGSGILTFNTFSPIYKAQHEIILGLNIPGYK